MKRGVYSWALGVLLIGTAGCASEVHMARLAPSMNLRITSDIPVPHNFDPTKLMVALVNEVKDAEGGIVPLPDAELASFRKAIVEALTAREFTIDEHAKLKLQVGLIAARNGAGQWGKAGFMVLSVATRLIPNPLGSFAAGQVVTRIKKWVVNPDLKFRVSLWHGETKLAEDEPTYEEIMGDDLKEYQSLDELRRSLAMKIADTVYGAL